MILMAEQKHVELLVNVTKDVLDDLPNYAGVEYDIEHSRNMLNLYINTPGLGCFFEADGDVLCGFIMGMVAPQWFTPTLEFSEIMFWVRKEYRKSNLAVRLLVTMEEWAIHKGAKKIFMAAASGYKTEAVMRFYNRRGYRNFSQIACKEI